MSAIRNKAAHYLRQNKIKAVSLVAVLALLLLSELGLRIYHKDFSWTHYPTFRQDYLLRNELIRPDEDLGWALPVNRLINSDFAVDANGLRVNRQGLDSQEPAMLVMGGGNALAMWLPSNQTLAAALERKLNKRVGNAGVYDYGVDQAVLHAERLAAKHKPEAIILTIDQYSWNLSGFRIFNGLVRPDYRLSIDGTLALRNEGQVGQFAPEFNFIADLFGYSRLADAIFSEFAPALWSSPWSAGFHVPELYDHTSRGCAFLHRFLEIPDVPKKQILVIPSPAALTDDEDARKRHQTFAQTLNLCLSSINVKVTDLAEIFDGKIKAGETDLDRLFPPPGQISSHAYEIVAEVIRSHLRP